MRNLGTLTRLWRREFWVNLCENSRFFVNFWLNSLKNSRQMLNFTQNLENLAEFLRNLTENSRQIVIASGFEKPRSNPLRAQGAFLDTNSHFLSTNSRPKNALRALMDCFEFATQILAMTGRGENSRKNLQSKFNPKISQISKNSHQKGTLNDDKSHFA